MARIAEGVGYSLQGDSARELKDGDSLVATGGVKVVIRASSLGTLKLEFFLVQPQFLNGLITVVEGHQLEQAARNTATQCIHFSASELVSQKFARLVAQSPRDTLPARSALMQLWSQAIAGAFLAPPLPAENGRKLRDRFRQVVGQIPDAELATRSLPELAALLSCSERHFSRLFRNEFRVSLRSRQTELRLRRAQQLLANANIRIFDVARESGYRHLGLFNAMFKKRFGVTPSEWRQKSIGWTQHF
jgi:AraC-like DNA-binding protein